MLIIRSYSWGTVFFDPETDEFWADVRHEGSVPRLDRILSITCRLAPQGVRRSLTNQWSRWSTTEDWLAIFDKLEAAGVMRLNLLGAEAIPRNDAVQLVRAAVNRGLGVVLSLEDCNSTLERFFLGFPVGVGLSVVIDPSLILRREKSGGMSLLLRLEILHQCVAAGLRVRVVTPYEPFSPVMLLELGEAIALAGVREWQILPPEPALGREPWHSSAGLEEVRVVRNAIPWLDVRYGNMIARERELVVDSGGTVQALEYPELRRILSGTAERLAKGELLSEAFLDRHAELWLSWTQLGREESVPAPRFEKHAGTDKWVFLSYNHQDYQFASLLREKLVAAGIVVWMDENQLKPGDLWQARLQEALDGSRAVIYCIGPTGCGPFQKVERAAALDCAARGELDLIPVLLPGVKGDSAIPSLLRAFQRVDFRSQEGDPLGRLVRGLLLDQKAPSADPVEASAVGALIDSTHSEALP